MLNAEYVVTLSRDEYDGLLLMLGLALGCAFERNDKAMAKRFLDLANAFARNDPKYQPYSTEGMV